MLRAVAPAGGDGSDFAAVSLAEGKQVARTSARFASIIGSVLVLHVRGLACGARLCLSSTSPNWQID
eukprot:6063551-Alexandrium_andersonii.AAC.1